MYDTPQTKRKSTGLRSLFQVLPVDSNPCNQSHPTLYFQTKQPLQTTSPTTSLHHQSHLATIPPSSNPTNSSNLSTITCVLSSRSNSSFPGLFTSTVIAPASYPAMISSMLSPTMIKGRGGGEAADGSSFLGTSTPHASAMCSMPAGEGLGGRKSRVTMGAKAEMWEGRCVWRRCSTGVLGSGGGVVSLGRLRDSPRLPYHRWNIEEIADQLPKEQKKKKKAKAQQESNT